MELVQHIRELLYHNDCVIVPGFGGFVTNERPARIDGVSNIFYPPSREVGFNARLDHNDGLLISYISSRLSVNYVDAKNLTESFATGVTRKLTAGKTVHFEGIGQFSADRHNNLQFEPDPSANFLTDAYGLSFFRFPALAAGESARRRKKSFYESDLAPVRVRMRKLLRYAAIGIPLIAALTWGAMNTSLIREYNFDLSSLNPVVTIFDSETEKQAGTDLNSDSPVEEKLEDMSSLRRALMYEETVAAEKENDAENNEPAPTEEAPVIENEETGGLAVIAAEADEPVSDEVDEPVPVSVARASHYIVAGSFQSRKNAMVLHDRLELQGYQCEVFESEKGMFRVTLFSSDNSREALKVLREMRAGNSNQDIWMLSI